MNEGQKIRKIREIRGYKQEYVADQLGMSAKSYGKIESGETSLSIARLQQIAKILDVDPVDVLSFDEKQFFHHCSQSGNINTIHNHEFNNERELYEREIAHLKEEIAFLRGLVGKQH